MADLTPVTRKAAPPNVSTAPVAPRRLTALSLAVCFAAQAIAEALARRLGGALADAPYSAATEIARLVEMLSALELRPAGLEPEGAAARARAALDDHLAHHPDEPLSRVERGLGLASAARDILRLLVAWSLEPRIGLLIGHLHDALQKMRPTEGALAEILEEPVAVALALAPTSLLRRQLAVDLDRHGPDGTLALDPWIATYVASGEASPIVTPEGQCALVPPCALCPAAAAPVASIEPHTSILVRGPTGSGRRSAARALAAREGRPLLLLDLSGKDGAPLVTLALRAARILGARLAVRGAVPELGAAEIASARDVPLAILLDPTSPLPEALLGRPLVPISLGIPSALERAAIWRAVLPGGVTDRELHQVAERYAFTPGRIHRAAAQVPTMGVEAACRFQIQSNLGGLAVHCPAATIGWDRLVLPPSTLEALRALASQVVHRAHVGEVWGFARHHALAQGVKALFFGKPGTGKTLAAEVLSHELSMPLYRIDLSRIVSKWIGETEQNLSRLFDEADQSHAILFFDEADSLFARRTAVQTSTDRYANMEVNYLLQRIEEHKGVIVLATNLKANMDEAFARRLHHVIEFPEPDEAARERIWRLSVPKEAPVDPSVDFARLARRFEISGGAIRNAVLGAAYHAAASGAPIQLSHIADALRAEYAKMDRLYPRTDLDALKA